MIPRSVNEQRGRSNEIEEDGGPSQPPPRQDLHHHCRVVPSVTWTTGG